MPGWQGSLLATGQASSIGTCILTVQQGNKAHFAVLLQHSLQYEISFAGFGALTPWRRHFVALTTVSLVLTHAHYRDSRRTALAAALALLLAGTPEVAAPLWRSCSAAFEDSAQVVNTGSLILLSVATGAPKLVHLSPAAVVGDVGLTVERCRW